MTENVRVSVIVPCYNCEKYIEKCIGTILEQSCSEIELIVVDDGSTDATPTLLSKLAADDPRVVLLCDEHKGVSGARNAGLAIARGEYVVFVDGDDYLAPDFLEYMLSVAEQTGADFCFSQNCYTRSDEEQIGQDRIFAVSSSEATARLLSPHVIVGCWNKIYKRAFLDACGLRFSTDLFYGEGLVFIVTAAQRAKTVGVGCRKGYYYRRSNEASATTRFSIDKLRNGETALERIEQMLRNCPESVADMLALHRATFALGALVRIRANHETSAYQSDYKRWLSYLRKSYGRILRSDRIGLYRKLLLLGGCVSPRMMARLDAIRRKRIAKRSVR